MTNPGTTLEGFVRSLEQAKNREAAERIARSDRRLADERAARAILGRFSEIVRAGRSPVDAARGTAQAAAAVARIDRGSFARAVANRLAGVLAHLQGRSAVARRKLDASAKLFAASGNALHAGDVYRILIDVLMLTGAYAEAHRAARRAERCYDRVGRVGARRRGALAMNLGNLFHRRDRLKRALAAYVRAAALYRRAGLGLMVANAQYNRANVLVSLDRPAEARRLYERARDVYRGEDVPGLVAQTDYALAGLDLVEGRLDACIERLDDVRRRHGADGDEAGVALAELDQAEALLRSNRPAEAERVGRRALEYFRRQRFDAETASCCGLLGGVALQQGRAAKAATLFRRGRDMERRRRNPVGAAVLATGLARAELKAGRTEAAMRSADRAAGTLDRHGLRSRSARALAVAADAALAAGRPRAARGRAERSLRLARACGDQRVRLSALLVLARIEDAAGRSAAAYARLLAAERCVEKLRRGVTSEESRLAFVRDKIEVYERLVMNRLDRGDGAAVRRALVFAERAKARAFAERLAGRSPGTVERSALQKRLDRLETELARTESRIERGRAAATVSGPGGLRALSRAHRETVRRLARRDPATGFPRDPVRTLERLERDERILVYTQADGHYHLLLVERGTVEAFRRVASVARVRDLANFLTFQLGKQQLGAAHPDELAPFVRRAIDGYLEELHALLIRPVAERLDGARVRIVPHGDLHRLAFHALSPGDRPLVERCTISYAPSLAVMELLGERAPRRTTPPLIVGVADSAAPAIEAEARVVKAHLPDARLVNSGLSGRRVIERVESHPRLLHLAGHGLYSGDEKRTAALQFGSARLTLRELYDLRGSGRIVVLSGCETGRHAVYTGDEWIGTVAAFLHAGAQAVVAALWAVHDAGTVRVMDDFYAEFVRGATVGQSLATAQRRARERGSPVFEWAPFVVVGDPDQRLKARVVRS
ncbi:MAG: CHAT domain-containing protein [bacterium]|nr:CHAT domain-containing protein [bacterium]